jgi:hypothetical protein
MTLSKEDKETYARYRFSLHIQNKEEPAIGQVIEMNGEDNLPNVFLHELLVELAVDLRSAEKRFEKLKKDGKIQKDKNGNWTILEEVDDKDKVVEQLGPESVIEHITDKKDFKNGPAEIKD